MRTLVAIFFLLLACSAITIQAASSKYIGNTLFTGPERRITFWYSANDLNTVGDAMKAIGKHPTAVWGVALYCGYSISPAGGLMLDTSQKWYCDENSNNNVIPQFQDAGVDVELVISDTKHFHAAFKNPVPLIKSVVDLAKKHNLYGINIDIEPEKNMTIVGKDARKYATFLQSMRSALNSINVRLTVNVGDWNPMLAQYFTLQHVVDRLVDMQTYKANNFVSWLATYNNMVNTQIAREKVAIGFATYPYTVDPSNPKWMSDPAGAQSRIAQLASDGVHEIFVFKLDPANNVPEDFWWKLFESYSTKVAPPYQGLPYAAPRRLKRRVAGHNAKVAKFGALANIHTNAAIVEAINTDKPLGMATPAAPAAGATLQPQASPFATNTPVAAPTPAKNAYDALAALTAKLQPAAAAAATTNTAATPATATAATSTSAPAAATATAAAVSPLAALAGLASAPSTAAGASASSTRVDWQGIVNAAAGVNTTASANSADLVKQAKLYASQRIAQAIAQAEDLINAAKAGKWNPNAPITATTLTATTTPAATATPAATTTVLPSATTIPVTSSAAAAGVVSAPSAAQASVLSNLLIGANQAAQVTAPIAFDTTATSNLVSSAPAAVPKVATYQQLLTGILAGQTPSPVAAAAAKSFGTAATGAAATPADVKGTPWERVLSSLKNLQSMVNSANATLPNCNTTKTATPATNAAAASIRVNIQRAQAEAARKQADLQAQAKIAALNNKACKGCNATDIKQMNHMLTRLLKGQDQMLDAHGIPREHKHSKKGKHSKHHLKAATIKGHENDVVITMKKGKKNKALKQAIKKAVKAAKKAGGDVRVIDIVAPKLPQLPRVRRVFHPEYNKNSPVFQTDMEKDANRRAIKDVEHQLQAAKSLDEQHVKEALPIIDRHDSLHAKLLDQIPSLNVVNPITYDVTDSFKLDTGL